jgi:hypothetical protein
MDAQMSSDLDRARGWLAQWQQAAPALERIRAEDLARLHGVDALRVIDTLLALSVTTPLPPHRVAWSGLIEFQRHLHRART